MIFFFAHRVDREMRQYTGALVGLGYDPRTSEALLPDHDSELVFDVDMTEDDIIHVRFALMNNVKNRLPLATPFSPTRLTLQFDLPPPPPPCPSPTEKKNMTHKWASMRLTLGMGGAD